MILIGLGANLPHPKHGAPRNTCEAALAALEAEDLDVVRRSRWYESAPVPPSDQPFYLNGVAELSTGLRPAALLDRLHGIESLFGRVRGQRNASRVLDLDLLAYGQEVSGPGAVPVLPHPRLTERAFVLLPLAELAPSWRHPVSHLAAAQLLERLPPGQTARPVEDRPE